MMIPERTGPREGSSAPVRAPSVALLKVSTSASACVIRFGRWPACASCVRYDAETEPTRCSYRKQEQPQVRRGLCAGTGAG